MVSLLTDTLYTYFCPRCGKPTQFNSERKGLCLDCFAELKGATLKQKNFKMEITVCVGCGKIRYGNSWFEPTRSNFDKILKNLAKRTQLRFYEFRVEMPTDIEISSLGQYDKIYVLISIPITSHNVLRRGIELRINKAFCPLCSKKRSGKYYESVLHIRFSRDIESEFMLILDEFINTSMIQMEKLEVIDVKKDGAYGVVIRFSDRKMARSLLTSLNKKFSLVILKRYREQVTVEINNKLQRRVVEKYFIRLLPA